MSKREMNDSVKALIGTRLKPLKRIDRRLLRGAVQTCGSIHAWNAPPATFGYLFCRSDKKPHEIAIGEYCDRWRDIHPDRYDYYLDFSDAKTVYKITGKESNYEKSYRQ